MANKNLWSTLEDWKKNCKWVELSWEVSPETPHWSGFPDMSFDVLFDYPDGFYVNKFHMVSQYGTHVDAPCHFVEGRPALDYFGADKLVSPLCVVDIRDKIADNVDYAVTRQDILDWEAKNGQIPEGAFVAIRTDWYKREDKDNMDADGNKHYPGWSMEALKYLIEERNVNAVGHEQSDTDAPVTGVYDCETYVLDQCKYQIELLKNLDQVPDTGAIIICGFPRVKEGAGFTARCIAICPQD